jgi:hypothetical protein
MTVEGNKIMMLHTDDEREDHQRFKALAQGPNRLYMNELYI